MFIIQYQSQGTSQKNSPYPKKKWQTPGTWANADSGTHLILWSSGHTGWEEESRTLSLFEAGMRGVFWDHPLQSLPPGFSAFHKGRHTSQNDHPHHSKQIQMSKLYFVCFSPIASLSTHPNPLETLPANFNICFFSKHLRTMAPFPPSPR